MTHFTSEQLERIIKDYCRLERMWANNARNEPIKYLRAQYQDKAEEYARLVGIARCELAGIRDTGTEGK